MHSVVKIEWVCGGSQEGLGTLAVFGKARTRHELACSTANLYLRHRGTTMVSSS